MYWSSALPMRAALEAGEGGEGGELYAGGGGSIRKYTEGQ